METLNLNDDTIKNKNISIDENIMSKIEHEYEFLSNDFKMFILSIKKQIYFNANSSIITFIDIDTIPKMLAYFKTSDYLEFNKILLEQHEIINAYYIVNDVFGNIIDDLSLITFGILLIIIGDLEEDLKIVKVDNKNSYAVMIENTNLQMKSMYISTNIVYH